MSVEPAAVLAQAFDQSYGKDVRSERLSGGARPVRATGPRRRLPPDALLPLLQHGSGHPGWPTVLAGAFGPHRVERHHPYGLPLRAFPSPRAAFPTTAHVATPSALAVYDPYDHALVRLRGDAFPDPAGPVGLLCGARPDALANGYGPLREALLLLEAGHAAATVQAICAAFGVEVTIDPVPPRLPDGLLPAFTVDLPVFPASGIVHAGLRLATALARRSSGRAPRGLTAAATRMPAAVLARAVAAVSGDGIRGLRPRVLLVAERVESLDDGAYEVTSDGLAPVRSGRMLATLQAAYRYPARASVTFGSLNAVWCFVVDYPAAVARHGPDAFRWWQLELGARAQRLALALAPDDYFARPIRAFDEDALDGPLRLLPHEQVGYAVLAGRTRFDDLSIDLRM